MVYFSLNESKFDQLVITLGSLAFHPTYGKISTAIVH